MCGILDDYINSSLPESETLLFLRDEMYYLGPDDGRIGFLNDSSQTANMNRIILQRIARLGIGNAMPFFEVR